MNLVSVNVTIVKIKFTSVTWLFSICNIFFFSFPVLLFHFCTTIFIMVPFKLFSCPFYYAFWVTFLDMFLGIIINILSQSNLLCINDKLISIVYKTLLQNNSIPIPSFVILLLYKLYLYILSAYKHMSFIMILYAGIF